MSRKIGVAVGWLMGAKGARPRWQKRPESDTSVQVIGARPPLMVLEAV
jgi:hypothetical protein